MNNLEYKLVAIAIIYFVAILCIIFYAGGNRGDRDEIAKEYQIPPVTFESWFCIGYLAISLLGFGYAMLNVEILSISFLLPATVMLVSLVILYIKLYFSLTTGIGNYTEVQTFAFNVLVNSVVLIIYIVLTSKRFISATLAMLPMIGIGIYFLYIGHLIAKN
jgi:hypothetical protein